MADLIDEYQKSGFVSIRKWYADFRCADCYHYQFGSEECMLHGAEVCEESPACESFQDKDDD